jgi:uncharacterized protein YbjT (DUF2867 family)
MRVLITGAYGLIGAACLGSLRLEGHDLIGAGRTIADASRAALLGMLAVSLVYAASAAVVAPQLFLDPLGRILKIFPIMLTNLFAIAILDER